MKPGRLPDGRKIDWKYFVNWRTWLWTRPTRDALAFLAPVEGKRVLEFGGGDGRMSCLMALMGAEVTMVDVTHSATVDMEIKKWNLAGRVRFVATDGTLTALNDHRYDAIFCRSVLWSVKELSGLLDEFDRVLDTGGKVAFVENYRGGRLLMWLRRVLVYRNRRTTDRTYFGIRPSQIELFRARFKNLRASRHRYFVYCICGEKNAERV